LKKQPQYKEINRIADKKVTQYFGGRKKNESWEKNAKQDRRILPELVGVITKHP